MCSHFLNFSWFFEGLFHFFFVVRVHGFVYFHLNWNKLIFTVLEGDVTLGQHPVADLFIWKHTMEVHGHFADDLVLLISLLLDFFIRVIRLDMSKPLLKALFFSFQLFLEVILEIVLEEHPSGDWVNGLLVHLFYLLNIGAEWNLVCRLDQTNPWQNELMSHFLNGFGHLSLNWCIQSGLEPVVEFTYVVKEFDHHGCVFVVNVLFTDTPHQLLTHLVS